jgi:hypothetical protein
MCFAVASSPPSLIIIAVHNAKGGVGENLIMSLVLYEQTGLISLLITELSTDLGNSCIIVIIIIKVKVTSEQATKAQRGSTGIALLFL